MLAQLEAVPGLLPAGTEDVERAPKIKLDPDFLAKLEAADSRRRRAPEKGG
jgi:hypothetical protein